MKILVIGGTGTMGRPLVDILSHHNDVYVICRKKVDEQQGVSYYYGDAKDKLFMNEVLKCHFDSIVDFCWYSSKEFESCYETLLNNTDQYVCLSSCAVVADSMKPLNEESPRFIDVTPPTGQNKNEYHYEKARIENTLIKSIYSNWTIVRPHITYSENHIVWGEYNEEEFLDRCIIGKKIVVPKDMLKCMTSLTYGRDVAKMIALLVGNKSAIGQIINVSSPEIKSWEDYLFSYKRVLENYGIPIRYCHINNSEKLLKAFPGLKYRYLCDRLLNRIFSIEKFEKIADSKIDYADFEKQINYCVHRYLERKKGNVKIKSGYSCARLDRITGEWTPLHYFYSRRAKMAYIGNRLPGLSILSNILMKIIAKSKE